jgi:hypothetical protein
LAIDNLQSAQINSYLYDSGKPRLGWARSFFLAGRSDPDLEGLKNFYREWRDFDEFVVLQRQFEEFRQTKRKTIAVKCSKRGNDVYRWRTKKRFQDLRVFLSLNKKKADIEFFNFNDVRPKVRVVFVTLTWIGQGSIIEAWERVSPKFNKWITRMRQKFGRISYIRAWEATKRGYPHVHLLLYFHDCELQGFRTVDNGEFIWRVEEKPEFEACWDAFVDVRAVRTFSSVLRYLQKRVLLGTDKGDQEVGDLTLALCWIFRKRSFAMSKDFLKGLFDLISHLHNSKKKIQSRLDRGYVKEVWVFLGIFPAHKLGLDGKRWCVELDWSMGGSAREGGRGNRFAGSPIWGFQGVSPWRV